MAADLFTTNEEDQALLSPLEFLRQYHPHLIDAITPLDTLRRNGCLTTEEMLALAMTFGVRAAITKLQRDRKMAGLEEPPAVFRMGRWMSGILD